MQKNVLPKGSPVRVLSKGAHGPALGDRLCALELVSYLNDPTAPITDAPPCVCPAIRKFVISWNDGSWSSDEERTRWIGPLLKGLLGTRTESKARMRKRAFLLADYACRVFAPIAFEARGLKDQARSLRALAPIRGVATAKKAHAAAYAAAYAADAAYAAADAADAVAAVAAAYAADAAAAAAASRTKIQKARQRLVRELCAI